MSTRQMFTSVVALCLMSMALLMVTGCGGSPIVSAMTKVGTGQIDTLTGAEIQSVLEKFAPGSALTTEQADQFAEFLAEAEVKTLTELMPLVKVVTGQMDTMSGEDILIVSDKFAPEAGITTGQADAIADFLTTNDVQTIQELQALVDQAKADPNSVDLPDGFEELFEGFDPSTLPDSFPI